MIAHTLNTSGALSKYLQIAEDLAKTCDYVTLTGSGQGWWRLRQLSCTSPHWKCPAPTLAHSESKTEPWSLCLQSPEPGPWADFPRLSVGAGGLGTLLSCDLDWAGRGQLCGAGTGHSGVFPPRSSVSASCLQSLAQLSHSAACDGASHSPLTLQSSAQPQSPAVHQRLWHQPPPLVSALFKWGSGSHQSVTGYTVLLARHHNIWAIVDTDLRWVYSNFSQFIHILLPRRYYVVARELRLKGNLIWELSNVKSKTQKLKLKLLLIYHDVLLSMSIVNSALQ